MIGAFLKSIATITFVSGALAFLLTFILFTLFPEIAIIPIGLAIFGVCSIIQLVCGYFIGVRQETSNTRIEEIATEFATAYRETLEDLSTPVQLNCAYCNLPNQVPISLLKNNAFTCNSCNQLSRVYIHFQTTRVTQPMQASSVDLTDIDMDIEQQNRQTTHNEPIEIK